MNEFWDGQRHWRFCRHLGPPRRPCSISAQFCFQSKKVSNHKSHPGILMWILTYFGECRNTVEFEIRQDAASGAQPARSLRRDVGPPVVALQELDGTFRHTLQIESCKLSSFSTLSIMNMELPFDGSFSQTFAHCTFDSSLLTVSFQIHIWNYTITWPLTKHYTRMFM
jgi:hypothetical protein